MVAKGQGDQRPARRFADEQHRTSGQPASRGKQHTSPRPSLHDAAAPSGRLVGRRCWPCHLPLDLSLLRSGLEHCRQVRRSVAARRCAPCCSRAPRPCLRRRAVTCVSRADHAPPQTARCRSCRLWRGVSLASRCTPSRWRQCWCRPRTTSFRPRLFLQCCSRLCAARDLGSCSPAAAAARSSTPSCGLFRRAAWSRCDH